MWVGCRPTVGDEEALRLSVAAEVAAITVGVGTLGSGSRRGLRSCGLGLWRGRFDRCSEAEITSEPGPDLEYGVSAIGCAAAAISCSLDLVPRSRQLEYARSRVAEMRVEMVLVLLEIVRIPVAA